METQKTPNSQSNLEGKKRSWRNQAPRLQTVLQSYSNQDDMVLAQINGNIAHALGVEELILLKHQYYPKQSTGLM